MNVGAMSKGEFFSQSSSPRLGSTRSGSSCSESEVNTGCGLLCLRVLYLSSIDPGWVRVATQRPVNMGEDSLSFGVNTHFYFPSLLLLI